MVPNHLSGHRNLHFLAQPVAGTVTAFGLLAIAAHQGISRRPQRIAAVSVCASAMAILLCGSLQLLGFAKMFDESSPQTIASAAQYELVSYKAPGLFSSDHLVIYLRGRDWLGPYEGKEQLACFATERSGAGPEWLLGKAEILEPQQVAFTTKDGANWTVDFNPSSLAPLRRLDRCTRAPDILND